jgi:hypothetical protein
MREGRESTNGWRLIYGMPRDSLWRICGASGFHINQEIKLVELSINLANVMGLASTINLTPALFQSRASPFKKLAKSLP